MSGYRELEIYRRSYQAAKAVYEMTEGYPKSEQYGITDQLRRASLSVPLNIAEGYGKKESQSEFKRFLKMAIGSANEMQVLIDFSKDMRFIGTEQHQKALREYEEICKMLNVFIQRLSKNI